MISLRWTGKKQTLNALHYVDVVLHEIKIKMTCLWWIWSDCCWILHQVHCDVNLTAAREREFLKDGRGTVLDVVKVFANHPCYGSGCESISLIKYNELGLLQDEP
jgi:hypothetical protein